MKVQLTRYDSQGALSASVGCPSKRDCEQEAPHGLPPKHLSPFCSTAQALPAQEESAGISSPGSSRHGACWEVFAYSTPVARKRLCLTGENGASCPQQCCCPHTPCQQRNEPGEPPTSTARVPLNFMAACKHRLTFLGNDRIQLMLSVRSECPVTVYFNHLAAFNSSWQCREAASPAGQAVGTAALRRAGIL